MITIVLYIIISLSFFGSTYWFISAIQLARFCNTGELDWKEEAGYFYTFLGIAVFIFAVAIFTIKHL